jgi:hypothetical protein
MERRTEEYKARRREKGRYEREREGSKQQQSYWKEGGSLLVVVDRSTSNPLELLSR